MWQVAGTRRHEREAHRRTILSMLETTPATVASPVAPGQPSEPIPDLDFDWRPRPLDAAVRAQLQAYLGALSTMELRRWCEALHRR